VFNTRVSRLEKQARRGERGNKHSATYFVEAQGLGNGTASYDASKRPSTSMPKHHFVTDGAPFGGKIVNPAEIVSQLPGSTSFAAPRSTASALAPARKATRVDTFLPLAQENYGQYQRVDEKRWRYFAPTHAVVADGCGEAEAGGEPSTRGARPRHRRHRGTRRSRGC
jgi:hypothetical protein